MTKKFLLFFVMVLLPSICTCSSQQTGQKELRAKIYSDEESSVPGRGLVSYATEQGDIKLFWRLLPEDPKNITFNIYRKEIGKNEGDFHRIAETNRNFYMDRGVRRRRYSYAIRPSLEGKEGKPSGKSIPLLNIGGKGALVFDIGQQYKQARVVTGDLNRDGDPEIVVSYSGNRHVDPYGKAWTKSEDTIKVAAFLPTGNRLWTVDLGWGIEAGEDYQPMVIWDLDGDGRAEVILKTNSSSNPLDYNAERITVLDGMSGQIRKEAKWPALPWAPGRKPPGALSDLDKGIWSDYNNDSRNYLAVAHLDGREPYVIAARGTYKSQKVLAFNKNLQKIWERNFGLDHYYVIGFPNTSVTFRDRLAKFWNVDNKLIYIWNRITRNQAIDQYRGTHSLPVADINDDGKEEILWGERCIGEKGKELWAIKERIPYPGHPDIVVAADILPSHEGKEVFFGREGGVGKNEKIGVYLSDQHGNILWSHWDYHHIDRGWVSKIVKGQEGLQCLAIDLVDKQESKAGPWMLVEPTGMLWNSKGVLLGNPPSSFYRSFPVDWDGDGVREIVFMDDGKVQKYGGPIVGNVLPETLWGADLFGDHREEIVSAPRDGKVYIFFNTSALEFAPRVTPIADRQYKNDLSRTAMQATGTPMEGGYTPRSMTR